MIFVLEHDRKNRETRWIARLDDSEMEQAQKLRLEAEMDALSSGTSPEIVVISAESELALQRSHSKYFPPEVFEQQLRAKASL